MISFFKIPQFVQDGQWECSYCFTSFLKFIDEQISELNLDIDPDFQREHVWTEQQQIDWIEFFLQGGRTGRTFYLNHPGWLTNYKGDFVLVDGKQRLNALRRFVNNEIKVFGHYYRQFSDKPDLVLHNVRVNVNTLKTRAEVLSWYLGFNGGGVPHSKEELDKVRKLLKAEESKK